MNDVLRIIKDNSLTYEQRVAALAGQAENSIEVLQISDEIQAYRDAGVICDLFEGNAPYRPRYIVPDYETFMRVGSAFLGLEPPTDIWEATHNLLILYKHVPSITTFPVYIGNLDTLLQPFIDDEEEAYRAIKLFFKHIDRTITDSFCHANIGPEYTSATRLILKAQRELEISTPNISLKYSNQTEDDLAIDAINTALITAKPSFANHEIFTEDLGRYAIASCYNGLNIGGGSYTLVRLNLGALLPSLTDRDGFFSTLLPDVVDRMLEYLDERIRFLVEESNFFENHFLVKEKLIHQDNFSGMFGLVGLAECVNKLMELTGNNHRFGASAEADRLGIEIMEAIEQRIGAHHNPHLKSSEGHYLLHAQVGLDSDLNVSPGCRIPIGEEPPLHQHLIQSAPFHRFFPSGIGDVFRFDRTYKQNPLAILDMIKGAFQQGMRYLSLYGDDCDVIRITGYLVKRSDMEKLKRGDAVLHDTVVLGLNSVENNRIMDRKLRKNEEAAG